jgi:DNA-binding Xre family transcriptional regulator
MWSQLPKDPYMKLSVINTMLRDDYPSLEELCEAMQISPEDLIEQFHTIDYDYDRTQNQFI